MPPFFPNHTIEWKLEEPPFVRRLSLSVVGMGIITGVVVHLYRWLLLAHRGGSWWVFIMLSVAGVVLLLGLTTAYLGNHPVRQWIWRAPLYALAVGATEVVMSALLVAAHVERFGSQRADWDDWASLSINIVLWRTVIIIVFALLLAGVVQWVRFALLKHEHRASTAKVMHEVREEEEAEARARGVE